VGARGGTEEGPEGPGVGGSLQDVE
jgi:hypothetical protein